jgi:hypothetical protein
VWKQAQAKDAQNGFLNCLLPTEVVSAIGFRIDEIETEILHASWALEFSHSLGQKRKWLSLNGVSVLPSGADIVSWTTMLESAGNRL